MNCREFENLLTDVVSERLMEVSVREKVLAHSKECSRCAARLADERTLNVGLQALATGTERRQTPHQVRTVLLTAFRQRQATLSSPTPAVVPIRSHRWIFWGLGAAAMLALCAVATVQMLALHFQVDSNKPPMSDSLPKVVPPSPLEGHGIESVIPPPELQLARNQSKATFHHHHGALRRNPPDGEADRVAEFIPLTYASPGYGPESGQIVRVRVSRSTLISMGMALNLDHGNDLVEAEVMLGDDGVAHGIRLIQ